MSTEEKRAANRAWHAANRDVANAKRQAYYCAQRDNANYPLNVRRFGINPERYVDLFAQQQGLCAICGRAERQKRNGRIKWLSVDHDHKCCPGDRACGYCVRGLLCGACNNGLGRFDDSPVFLRAAALYLEAY